MRQRDTQTDQFSESPTTPTTHPNDNKAIWWAQWSNTTTEVRLNLDTTDQPPNKSVTLGTFSKCT